MRVFQSADGEIVELFNEKVIDPAATACRVEEIDLSVLPNQSRGKTDFDNLLKDGRTHIMKVNSDTDTLFYVI